MTGGEKPELLVVTLIHQALRVDADRMVAAASALNPAEVQRLDSLRLFFDEYRGQLCLHHAHEDGLFFPALQAVVDESRRPIAELEVQHGALEAQARKLIPRRRARFLIPWIVDHATPEQKRDLFRSAPPLRAAYLVNRHRYRLFDRALLLTRTQPRVNMHSVPRQLRSTG